MHTTAGMGDWGVINLKYSSGDTYRTLIESVPFAPDMRIKEGADSTILTSSL